MERGEKRSRLSPAQRRGIVAALSVRTALVVVVFALATALALRALLRARRPSRRPSRRNEIMEKSKSKLEPFYPTRTAHSIRCLNPLAGEEQHRAGRVVLPRGVLVAPRVKRLLLPREDLVDDGVAARSSVISALASARSSRELRRAALRMPRLPRSSRSGVFERKGDGAVYHLSAKGRGGIIAALFVRTAVVVVMVAREPFS